MIDNGGGTTGCFMNGTPAQSDIAQMGHDFEMGKDLVWVMLLSLFKPHVSVSCRDRAWASVNSQSSAVLW